MHSFPQQKYLLLLVSYLLQAASNKIKWTLFLVFFSIASLSQNRGDLESNQVLLKSLAALTVTGSVTDLAGKPLMGATVIIRKTGQGTITNFQGVFSLSLQDQNAHLIVSYTGYETREVSLEGRSALHVILAERILNLEEVVVIGYGIQKKVNLTGAVSKVDAEVLENRPITSVGIGLQGLIPNLNVTVRNGDPAEAANFNIRGFESINGGEPLILVDGIPMALERINPNDIASVNVLKDASAAAVYGSRAAFGVILVETKSGKRGKPRVSFSTELSVARPIFHVDIVEDPVAYVEIMNQADIRNSSVPRFNDDFVAAVKAYSDGTGPEWGVVGGELQYYGFNNYQNELMADYSPQQKYNLNISGAGDKTAYYLSLGHLNKDGYWNHANNEQFKRYNLLMKADFKLNKWLSLQEKVVYNRQGNDKPTEYASSFGISPFLGTYPNEIVQFPDLEYYLTPGDRDQFEQYVGLYFDGSNFPYLQGGGRTTFHVNDTWLSQGITIRPLSGMVFKGDFSYNNYQRTTQQAFSKVEMLELPADLTQLNMVNGLSGQNYIENRNDFDQYYTLNAYAEYTPQIGADHYLKGMIGFNQEWGKYSFQRLRANDLITPAIANLNATTGLQEAYGGKKHVALRGAFYRFNYIFKDRYLFEANGRRDGTSRFPKEDRFGFFPSFSAGWRISEEPFMSGLGFLDNLKIRASYGTLGNQSLGENYYPYIPTMESGLSRYMMRGGSRISYVAPPGLVSPTLTWETVVAKNLGLDFTLFDQRLDASFDSYTRDTRDMLMSVDYPGVLGTSAPKENAADLRTKGWEAALSWQDRIDTDWKYQIALSLADWQTEITKYENPTGALSEYYVGQRIGEIWGYETVGIFQTEEEVAAAADQSQLGTNWRPGDIRYADLNGDGKINPGIMTLDSLGDLKIIGNESPRYTFGIHLDLHYKNFSLQTFFQGVGKRDYWPNDRIQTWFFPFQANYVEWYHITDTWTKDNRDAYFFAPQHINGLARDDKNVQRQSRFIQDASYIRLKNLTLSYKLPVTLRRKIGLSAAQIYVTGMNLWEASMIRKPLDPEYLRRQVLAPEFDNGGFPEYPLQRIYAFGLRVSF